MIYDINFSHSHEVHTHVPNHTYAHMFNTHEKWGPGSVGSSLESYLSPQSHCLLVIVSLRESGLTLLSSGFFILVKWW